MPFSNDMVRHSNLELIRVKEKLHSPDNIAAENNIELTIRT